MKLYVKPTAECGEDTCTECTKRADVILEVHMERKMPKIEIIGRLQFCYNCLNTALSDAIGHGIKTEFTS